MLNGVFIYTSTHGTGIIVTKSVSALVYSVYLTY